MDSFTSLPPEQESSFLVYEQRMVGTSKTANNVGWGVAIAMFVLLLIVVYSFPAPKHEGPAPEGAPAAAEPAK